MTRGALYVRHMTPKEENDDESEKKNGDANDEYDLNGRRFHLDCLRSVLCFVYFFFFGSLSFISNPLRSLKNVEFTICSAHETVIARALKQTIRFFFLLSIKNRNRNFSAPKETGPRYKE